jgi:4-amino-4-deoxy-L-arabinose transferase-like glycosyltransferase
MTAEVPQPADKPADPFFRWLSLRPRLLLVLAVVAALGPFLGKPLNFDDPLFLWTARQIQAHPANPYGFKVNWYGVESPMWDVTKNPPLSSYYLAMAAAFLGWGEKALHFAFLLPAVAAILGTYRLACRFTNRPVFAACATLFTPVFLVSSTTLMCDTLMLAFWVWAVVLWVEGIEGGGSWRLACAGLLMALAALTKYFGACLVPLLIAYSLIHRRRLGGWVGFFLIPVAALAAYQWITAGLYGRGLLSDAGAYVSFIRDSSAYSGPVAGVTALAFTGGCLAVATFLSPLLWRKRAFAGLALVFILAVAVVRMGGTLSKIYGDLPGSSRSWLEIQIIFWGAGGASVLALAFADAWNRRDAPSCLLALWVFGTILFAGFFNWIVNGRSILPMAPAVGILLARRLGQGGLAGGTTQDRGTWICFGAGAALALWVAHADLVLANAARLGAEQTYARFAQGQGTLWFEGHWGFQYYLEKLGPQARAVVSEQSKPHQGDFLAVPMNNTNADPPESTQIHPWRALVVNGPLWLTTHSKDVGAGFYASVWGPLPFAFGQVPPERVLVYVVGQPPDGVPGPSPN